MLTFVEQTMQKQLDMKSEVELNSKLIRVGDELLATGGDWYKVTELFEGGFSAKCEWEENGFFFNELQIGWVISEKTKESHRINDKFKYNS